MADDRIGLLIRGAALALAAALLPRLLATSGAAELWQGGPAQVDLARQVASKSLAGVGANDFHTGSARFDGEWAFGTHLMTTLGLGQVALEHPELRAELLPAMSHAVERMLAPETNAFGTEAWGNVGLRTLPDGHGHGYLGYANLALSMLRLVDPQTRFAALSDELSDAMASRLAAAPHALFETYPGEAYAPDMSMVAGSIALHDCAAGRAERPFFPAWRRAFERYIDPASGLLYQAAEAETGRPLDAPRGSGAAIAAYALSFFDRDLSARLYDGVRRHAVQPLGFGMMHEYAPGKAGRGDIDSGPVLLGVGVSATGFALAGARLHRDREQFTALYRTVNFVGVPLGGHFMSGGPLGNAILLAMTSASFEWQKHCRKVSS
ncbi:MAG: hypothetical protein EOO73_21150 [Myxococcales bacterium]|nr:MAG: hypothetical protein EOO73_21150 [Myxococcales bacterium]